MKAAFSYHLKEKHTHKWNWVDELCEQQTPLSLSCVGLVSDPGTHPGVHVMFQWASTPALGMPVY